MRAFLKWLVVVWTVLAMGSCVLATVVLDEADDMNDQMTAEIHAEKIAEKEAELGRPLNEEERAVYDDAVAFMDNTGTATNVAIGGFFYFIVFGAWFVIAVPAVIISSLFRKDGA